MTARARPIDTDSSAIPAPRSNIIVRTPAQTNKPSRYRALLLLTLPCPPLKKARKPGYSGSTHGLVVDSKPKEIELKIAYTGENTLFLQIR